MHLDPEQLERTLHGELRPDDGSVREHRPGVRSAGFESVRPSRTRPGSWSSCATWIIASHRRRSGSARRRPVGWAGPGRSGWRQVWRSRLRLQVRPMLCPALHFPGRFTTSSACCRGPAAHRRLLLQFLPHLDSRVDRGSPGNHFAIVFSGVVPAGSARLSLTSGADLLVRALDGANFQSDVDRLLVESKTPGAKFEVEIPRSAPSVEIRVGGRIVFRKDSSRIATNAPISADGSYRLMLGN